MNTIKSSECAELEVFKTLTVRKEGAVQPLSGPNAQFGINCRNGIELVADAINAAGGYQGARRRQDQPGCQRRNIESDNGASRRPTSDHRERTHCGPRRIRIVVDAGDFRGDSASRHSLSPPGVRCRGLESVFKVTAKASVIGRAQVNYTLAMAKAAGSEIEKIAIMYENTAYGVAQSRGLRRAAKDANIEVVVDEPYPLGMTDARPLIDKLGASGAQASFPLSYLNDSLFIVRAMRQQHIPIPVIGGAAGYIIPDFEKGLGEFAEDVLSISPTNYDLAPALTDPFRKRFGFFMVHEAIESAVTLDLLVQAIEKAKSAKPKAVTEALHGARFEDGWTKAMPGGVQFDQTGLNTLSVPIMVQWRKKELVTVWPKDFAKASAVWHS
jgi:branched-chain amino acid transport system substrate-binding protein